ncbi:amidohydrolase family protein [Ewingella sp. S1.OA.A_B6]
MSNKKGNIAFCPTSNLFLGSGLFYLNKARKNNIKVGLGTDVGAGTSLSMIQTMDEAYNVTQLRKAFTSNPQDVTTLTPLENLYLATLAGAELLSLDDKIGSFTAGKEADFVVLDPMAGDALAIRNKNSKDLNERLFAIEMMGDDSTVEHTYIMGNMLK